MTKRQDKSGQTFFFLFLKSKSRAETLSSQRPAENKAKQNITISVFTVLSPKNDIFSHKTSQNVKYFLCLTQGPKTFISQDLK